MYSDLVSISTLGSLVNSRFLIIRDKISRKHRNFQLFWVPISEFKRLKACRIEKWVTQVPNNSFKWQKTLRRTQKMNRILLFRIISSINRKNQVAPTSYWTNVILNSFSFLALIRNSQKCSRSKHPSIFVMSKVASSLPVI